MAATSIAPSRKPYEVVTQRIIDQLETGTLPWAKPWAVGQPANLVTRRPYRGINSLLLGTMPYGSPYWLTYRQAKELVGHVRKGEHGTPVVFWKVITITREPGDGAEDAAEVQDRHIPFLRYYTVFNVEQCDGIQAPATARPAFNPIAEAERIAAGMPNPPALQHGGPIACYRPSLDVVQMPTREAFDNPQAYYSTLFHELTHSSGHQKRLDRATLTDLQPFGSTNYSKEELVAELGAAFLCAQAGIENATVNRSTFYIAGWLQALQDDRRMVITAAAQAQKAADYILGRMAESTATPQPVREAA